MKMCVLGTSANADSLSTATAISNKLSFASHLRVLHLFASIHETVAG